MGTPANLEALAGARRDVRRRADRHRDRDRGLRGPAGRGRAASSRAPPAEVRVDRGPAALAARRRRERRADLDPRRVRDARGAPRADRGHARLPLLRPRLRARTRSSSSAAARSSGCWSWARGAARRCSARSGWGSRTSCARAPSASSPPPARARRRPRACSTAPRSASRRSSASAGATCRRRSAGSCSARRCGCSPPTTARTRCCSSPSRPSREVVQKLGEVDVNGKRVIAAFVGWEGGEAPFEIHPTLDAGAFAAAGVEAPDDRGPRSAGRRAAASAGSSSACTRAARSPTRPRRSSATATRSSTSARRSTRRAGRTRWSTSACGWRCSRTSKTTSAACCSTWSSATARTPTPRQSWRPS